MKWAVEPGVPHDAALEAQVHDGAVCEVEIYVRPERRGRVVGVAAGTQVVGQDALRGEPHFTFLGTFAVYGAAA